MEEAAPERCLGGRYVLQHPLRSPPGDPLEAWTARDLVLGREVGVRLLGPAAAADPGAVERFRRAAAAAARVVHPALLRVFDSGVDGVPFVVTERPPGRSLQEAVGGRALDPGQAVAVILQVLSGLDVLHRNGLTHGDLRAESVLVGADGRVRLVDPGLRAAAEGREVRPGDDVRAAGALLYRLLTGRHPGPGAPACGDLRPGIPRDLDRVVLRLLHPEGTGELTAQAAGAALERFAWSPGAATALLRPVPAPSPPPVPADASSLFRSWMLVPLTLLAAGAALIGAALALGRLEVGGPLGLRPPPRPSPSSPPPRPRPLAVAEARDVDPQGTDRSEHPEDAPFAIDHDPATAWYTDHYRTALFGNLKDGVGLWLQLQAPARVTQFSVQSPVPGWTFQLRAEPDPSAPPLAAVDRSTSFTVGPDGTAVVRLGAVRVPGLLIWITGLAPDRGRYAAAVAEVEVRGLPA